MTYRLLCTDIDGTLANSQGGLSPRSRAAIRAAFERGRFVTLATGRHPARLGVFGEAICGRVPLICCNGALLTDSRSGAVLSREPLPWENVGELLRRMPGGATVALWHGEEYWIAGPESGVTRYRLMCGFAGRPLEELTRGEGVSADKLVCMGRPELVAQALRTARERPVPGAAAFLSDEVSLEFTRSGVDKGSGLRRCAALLGIDKAEVIAVGDHMNDAPMLSAAGLSVAVSNASESALRAAALTVPSNDEDGVAWLIENYLL